MRWKFWQKEKPVADNPKPMKSKDIEIVERAVPVLEVKVKTLNAIGEKRPNASAIRLARNDAGTYLLPLDGVFASYADAALLRELADHMEASEQEEKVVEVGTSTDS